MGRLETLETKEIDKGHIQACGKMRKGDDLFEACVIFSAVDGRPLGLQSHGDPEVQDEIIKRMQNRIRVR